MNAAAGAIPRELLAPLIRKSASEDDVRKAAAAIEAFVGDVVPRRQELGRIARTIVDSGKLENYGTPAAQQQLRTWARKFAAAPATDPPQRPAPPRE